MLKPCPRCGSDNISIVTFPYEGATGEELNHLTFMIFTIIRCEDCHANITANTIKKPMMIGTMPRGEICGYLDNQVLVNIK